MSFDLTGRVVAITGGNRGIGLGMANSVASAGASVAGWARDESASTEAVAQLEQLGGEAAAFAVDVTDPGAVDEAIAAVGLEATQEMNSPASLYNLLNRHSFCQEQFNKPLAALAEIPELI